MYLSRKGDGFNRGIFSFSELVINYVIRVFVELIVLQADFGSETDN